MRLLQAVLGLLIASVCVAAWTKDDHELFDLIASLETAEGKGTNFYNWLDIEPSAKTSDITKAYRKKSLELHPDKNPGIKDINARYSRLGVVAQILRSPERRERYNFFYKNGVPRWRGTGYYYARYRPTLAHTLLFLVFLSSALQVLVQRLNYNRDRKRVEYFEQSARAMAGLKGPSAKLREQQGRFVPGERRRKVRVPMVPGRDDGQSLDLIVDGEEVYIPHDDGTEEPLSGLAIKPSVLRTWPVTLAQYAYHRIQGAKGTSSAVPNSHSAGTSDDDEEEESESTFDPDTPTPAPRPRSAELREQRRKGAKKAKGKEGKEGKGGNGAEETEWDMPSGNEPTEENGAGNGEARKKKGLGKAGAARRRKMMNK